MSSTLTDGNDVVYLIDRSQSAFLKAALAERVGSGVAVSDAFPCASVLPVNVRAAGVLVVLLAGLVLVLLAVRFICQVRAAGKGTGAFGFPWHRVPPFRA